MVGQGRLELPTSRLSVVRSNQLSYAPEMDYKIIIETVINLIWEGIRERRRLKLRSIHYCLFLRKEVIQPQVPLQLPCYDFTPVADLTVVGCFLAVSAPASGKANSHGVTGGVYKARERIHRGMLIRDY